jgi:hypothetical protein
MGTSLTGKNISASYLGLLKTTDNAIIGSTAKRLTDGGGTDSPLYLSTTQLGIGVSPMTKLHVQGTDVTSSPSAEQLIVAENNGNTAIGIFSSLTGQGSIDFGDSADNNAGRILYEHNDNNLSFSTNGSRKMSILSDGKIGIGTSTVTSGYDVDVLSSGGDARILLRPSSNDEASYQLGNSSGDILTHFATSNGSSIINHAVGTGTLQLKTNASKAIEIDSSQNIQFNAYGSGTITGTATQRLGVDSSGNVIEIPIGAGAVDGSGTAGVLTKWEDSNTITDSIMSESGSTIEISSASTPQLRATDTTNTVTSKMMSDNSAGYVGTHTNHNFNILRNNSVQATFTSTGLGLGTTSPADKFVVKGGSAGNADLVSFQNSNGNETHRFYTDSDNDGVIETVTNAGTIANLIQSSGSSYFNGGNVGIGETNPSYKLHAVGSGSVASFGDGTRAFRIFTDSDEVSLLADGSVDMKFYTSGAEKMRLDSSGNVGINDTVSGNFTTNYDTKLLVGGEIIARSLTANESMISIGGDSTSAFIKSGKQDGSLTDRALRFVTGEDERMRIDSSGTVSIPLGTRVTTGKGGALIVGGDADGTGTTTNTRKIGLITCPSYDNTDGNMAMITGDTTDSTNNYLYLGSAYTGYSSPTDIIFRTTSTVGSIGSERMRIDSSGNVGIGNSSPTVAVDVKGTTNLASRFKFTKDLSTDKVLFGGADHDSFSAPFIGSESNHSFTITQNGGQAITINTSKNVGIGTSAPDRRLHIVDGSTGVTIQGTTGDAFIQYNTASNNAFIGLDDSLNLLKINNTNSLGSANHLVIDTSGNVGIGNSSPVTSLTLGTGTTGMSFISSDTSFNSGKIAVIKQSEVGSGNGHLLFETYEGGSGGGERMRITSGGDIALQPSTNIYTVRSDSVSVPANTSTTVLDFTGATAGVYMVTVCRSGVSTAENATYIISFNGTTGTIEATLHSQGWTSPTFSGANFQVSNSNARTCHATAQPLSVN